MAPWEDAGLVTRATTEGGRGSGHGLQLGDRAYASGEDFCNTSQTGILAGSADVPWALDDRRKAKRLQIVQSILDQADEPLRCRRCSLSAERHTSDRRHFFQEIEHLRRGLHKLLDTCGTLMSTGAFLHLRDSLQLGVRFFTDHAEGEMDVPLAADYANAPPPVNLKDLEQECSRLEDEVRKLERENARLNKEVLQKANEARLSRAGIRGGLNGVASVESQTDPVYIGAPGQQGGGRPGSRDDSMGYGSEEVRAGRGAGGAGGRSGGGQHRRGKAGRDPRRSSQGGDSSDDDYSDDDPSTPGGPTGNSRRRKKGGAGGAGGDHYSRSSTGMRMEGELRDELQKAKDELEAMKRRLSAAEQHAAQEQRKAAAAVYEADVARNKMASAFRTASKEASGDEGSRSPNGRGRTGAGAGGAGGSEGEDSGDERGRKAKRKGGGRAGGAKGKHKGGRSPRGSNSRSGSRDSADSGAGGRGAYGRSGRSAGRSPKGGRKPEMVDKGIMTDPPEHPPRVRGRSFSGAPQEKPLPELNKTGHCYQRNFRQQPNLTSGASPLVQAAAATAAATANASSGAQASGGKMAQSATNFASTAPSSNAGAAKSWTAPASTSSAGLIQKAASTGNMASSGGFAKAGVNASTPARPAKPRTLVSANRGGISPGGEFERQATAGLIHTKDRPVFPVRDNGAARVKDNFATNAKDNFATSFGAGDVGLPRSEARQGGAPNFSSKERPVKDSLASSGGSGDGGPWSGSSKFGVDFAASASSPSLNNSFSSPGGSVAATPQRDAEPYLLQVWEQRPQGHKKPSQKELVRLGALTPSPPQLVSH